MEKALTKEDLILIMEAIFKLSAYSNNAFQMKEDGLFVENFRPSLEEHTNNESIHIDEAIRDMIKGFTVSEDGILLYNEVPVVASASEEENNGIIMKPDGIYAYSAEPHINDEDIHVTTDDKDNWNNTYQKAIDYTDDEIKKLVIYDMKIVPVLPEIPVIDETMTGDDEEITPIEIEYPSSTTLYFLEGNPECPEECTYTLHMYLGDKWVNFTPTNVTFNKFALKTEVEDSINKIHSHNNQKILDRFTLNEDGELVYDGTNIHEIDISTEPGNAAQIIEGKLFIPDLSEEVKSATISSAWAKINLLEQEITDSGVYDLKDSIDNYNLLLVEYYYKPSNPEEPLGCAKTAVIDTDVLKKLFDKGLDYMLDYGYGTLTSNSRIRMNDKKLWVDYYHNVCIYQITGIRRGDDNE